MQERKDMGHDNQSSGECSTDEHPEGAGSATPQIAGRGREDSMIKKVKEGYRVVSEKGRNMGTYPTKEGAAKRLRQVEFFKHKKAQH